MTHPLNVLFVAPRASAGGRSFHQFDEPSEGESQMAIEQGRSGRPGSEQGLGVDVGAQEGTGRLFRGETEAALTRQGAGAAGDAGKPLKPLPHAFADYAMAGMLMAA